MNRDSMIQHPYMFTRLFIDMPVSNAANTLNDKSHY